MEVCVDSVESAINAEKGGATRVELCGSLVEGGITPSYGLYRMVKSHLSIPVFVIIRPRGGDFFYTDNEMEVMKEDISMFTSSHDERADGFVFGCLKRDGTVDKAQCEELINLARPSSVTFHRAIDMARDLTTALEDVIDCGFDRVLTSGGRSSALEGLPVLADLVQQAKDRVIIMPGGGISDNNIERILQGCGAKEFHCSARSSRESVMNYQKQGVSMGASFSPSEFSIKVTDPQKVQAILQTATNYWSS